MSQVVIENPILNSPYVEPTRHFKFGDDGITDEIAQGRRESSYVIPIPRAKKQGKHAALFDTEWTQDRIEPNKLVNRIRQRVDAWRAGNYFGVTPITRRLLQYWTDPAREKKFFFCQIEALETAIYIREVAPKTGNRWIENDLRAANDSSNPGLPRYALKMATGTGKTVVMAMLIAWHALNKFANTQDARFSDTFLFIVPGITIRDRLRVLLPTGPSIFLSAVGHCASLSVGRIAASEECFFVHHDYFTGADEPYDRLKRALRAEIDEGAWSSLYSTASRPFPTPKGKKVAVKVINHYGDEVLKVYSP